MKAHNSSIYHANEDKTMGYELDSSADFEEVIFLGANAGKMTHVHISCGSNSSLFADEMLAGSPPADTPLPLQAVVRP